MPLDFPASPAVNDTYTYNGWSWRWDGSTWVTNTYITGPTGATGPAAAVAGSNTQVIFNDSGAYAGDSGMVFDKTTDTLTVLGPVVGSNIASTTGYRLINKTVITNPTTSYTTPAGCTRIFVQMIAGGGGSGGITAAATSSNISGAGGGGSYAEEWFTVTPSTAYTVAVGLGGTAGTTAGTAGGTGGNTTFTVGGVTVTCNGGVGGAGSTTPASTALYIAGGSGGAISTNGDVNLRGAPGGFSLRTSATVAFSGAGGNGLMGQGAGAGQAVVANNTGFAGIAAGSFGAGAGGAVTAGNTARAGATGSNGVIIVWAYGI